MISTMPRMAAEVDRVRAVVRDHAARTDAEAAFPDAALAALRDTRLLGLLVPEQYGGAGGTLADLIAVTRDLARDCTSVALIFAMHGQQVAAVDRYASDALRAELLPRIARGEVYLASVTTEPGSGGHLLSSAAELTGDAAGLHLERTAPIVTGGTRADGFLVTMRARGAASPNAVSLVYADRDQLELEVLGGWSPLGMRATYSVPMRLTGDVPASQVLGKHGEFRDIAVATFVPFAHLGWAACWLGTADGALSRTVRLLRSERQRRDLGSELLLHRLSKVRQRLDTVHALIQHACARLDEVPEISAPPVQLLLNAVKLTASEQCYRAVDELVELLGMRHGYATESPLFLERALRDLRSASLNYSNDRLHAAGGALTLLDQDVRHV